MYYQNQMQTPTYSNYGGYGYQPYPQINQNYYGYQQQYQEPQKKTYGCGYSAPMNGWEQIMGLPDLGKYMIQRDKYGNPLPIQYNYKTDRFVQCKPLITPGYGSYNNSFNTNTYYNNYGYGYNEEFIKKQNERIKQYNDFQEKVYRIQQSFLPEGHPGKRTEEEIELIFNPEKRQKKYQEEVEKLTLLIETIEAKRYEECIKIEENCYRGAFGEEGLDEYMAEKKLHLNGQVDRIMMRDSKFDERDPKDIERKAKARECYEQYESKQIDLRYYVDSSVVFRYQENIKNARLTEFYNKRKEIFDSKDFYEFLPKIGLIINESLEQRLRASRHQTNKLYDSNAFRQLVDLHKTNNGGLFTGPLTGAVSYNPVGGYNLSPYASISDMEINDPNDPTGSRRKAFLDKIFNRNAPSGTGQQNIGNVM